MHFPGHRIPLPNLHKKNTFKSLFTYKRKESAELLKDYLLQSIVSPIGKSSLFKDFLSVQRKEDRMMVRARQPSGVTLPKESSVLSLHQFETIRVLGKGATGKVVLVRKQENKKLFALKTIHKSWSITSREVNHIMMERDILANISELNHPFLIQLHGAFQDPNNLYLVLDYHSGADLATLLQRSVYFPQYQCRLYCAEILLGLQELHHHAIIYRDLKPENVLIANDGHIVLTDFGLSKMFHDHEEQRTETYCGTPEYLALEIILQEEDYSYAVDYWSLGTMLYEMITGVTPFAASTPNEMFDRVLYDDLIFPSHCEPEAMDLIAGFLERDPMLRLGMGGVFETRLHPYFTDHLNWNHVITKQTSPFHVPAVSSETDLTHFDPDFLCLSTDLTETTDYPCSSAGLAKDAFTGYSFINN
ncbi:unnamed protein product [Rhizopus stolonifer]